jgi:hypothetical protein
LKIIKAVVILTVLLIAANGWGFVIFLKNGQVLDAEELKEDRGLLVIKLKAGNQVGMPKEDIDWEKSKASIDKYQEGMKKEEADKKRRKELEEKEKKQFQDIAPTFAYDKRGMQMVFAEDEAAQLIDIGDKNSSRIDDIIAPYSFSGDYMPSVIYTRRLRLILYGAEKAKSKKPVITTEVQNIIQDPNLLVLLVVTSDSPDYYKDSDFYIEQSGARIKPFNIKFQPKGERTNVWPASPAYYWKILINFRYGDIDLSKQGRLVVKKEDGNKDYMLDFMSYR